MQYLYHATPYNNLINILNEGIKPSLEGYSYLTEKPEQAVMFLAIRGIKEILVVKIKILKEDEQNIIETFDHSASFFKCRCFGHIGVIKTSRIKEYYKYEL